MTTRNPRLGVLALAALISLACCTSSYAAGKADTSRTMMRLSAKAADAKAKRDLQSILQPTGRFTRGNRIRVSGITVDTAPYGAGFKGLCRMDELFLVYGSTVKGPNNINDPLQPVGLDAERLFHVINGPVADFTDGFSSSAAWKDSDCSKLKSDNKAQWFSADDALQAAKGANVLLAVTEAIRSGLITAKDCDTRQFGTSCEEKILQIGQVNNIVSVKKGCPAGPQRECYEIMMAGSVRLTIVAMFEDENSITPKKIESISAAQWIVVT